MLRWAYLQPLTKRFHGRTQVFLLEPPPFKSLDSHAPQGPLDPFQPAEQSPAGDTKRLRGTKGDKDPDGIFSRPAAGTK